ncbi:MAG: cupredoxin domain-containing protein [Acidimicrobiia bacterium]
MRSQLRIGLGALAVLSILSAACGDSASTDLKVTTTDFQFSPNSWTVPAGEEISIDITNDGSVLHEWVLLQSGVTIDSEADLPETEEELLADFVYVEDEVDAGATKTLTFTAPEAGTYQIICAIETHFDAGMEGELTVVAG